MIKIRYSRGKYTGADTMWRRDAWTEHHIDRKPVVEEVEKIVIRSTWEKYNIDIFFGVLAEDNLFTKSKDVRKKVLFDTIRRTISHKLGKE
jgi:hypothetical protein